MMVLQFHEILVGFAVERPDSPPTFRITGEAKVGLGAGRRASDGSDTNTGNLVMTENLNRPARRLIPNHRGSIFTRRHDKRVLWIFAYGHAGNVQAMTV